MEPVRSFSVHARLPEELEGLREVVYDLAWTWDPGAQDLFRRVIGESWDVHPREPIGALAHLDRDRLDSLANDPGFLSQLEEVRSALREARERPGWFSERPAGALRRVAYFSPEFGIAEAIPQYSGGLGALAGDHLKAASDLGVPLVGVGLLYHHGYFRQELDPDGWQQERYPTLDPLAMALEPVDRTVELEVGEDHALVRLWRAGIGRVPLYLLDANVDGNPPGVRTITDRLYGGGEEHRIRQEILLGIGGVRALEALDEQVQVFHMNEGHAGFLALERIRRAMVEDGLELHEAVEAVRAGTIFTTHTSVPAGIDRFPADLLRGYFSGWAEACGVDISDLLRMGRWPEDDADAPFNMAVMAMRLAGFANGVSRLHGHVSRSLFGGLWPAVETDEVPVTDVTNGVHARSWTGPEVDVLLSAYVGDAWPLASTEDWSGALGIADRDLWDARARGRERLVEVVRRRLRGSERAKGVAEWDLGWCDEVLDPEALTIGFSRRFASYKRATLLLRDPDRLRRLLGREDRPVQLVFAGKAHPADDAGKEAIREIVRFSRDPALRGRVVFVEDYDISLARALYQGADVWLNTPRRPHEACGTSGMKAALNGGLNLSVLDGWWDEAFDGTNGWAIPSAERYPDDVVRDEVEAGALFEILEARVVPLFHERDADGLPRRWLERIRTSLASLGPMVTASRMLRDYVEGLYEPAGVRTEVLTRDGYARARSLAGWKARVRSGWDGVSIRVDGDGAPRQEVGTKREVTGAVALGVLGPDDVSVEVVHGPLDAYHRILDPLVVQAEWSGQEGDERRFRGSFSCDEAGGYGFTVRVVPSHPDLWSYAELGLVRWA